MPTDNASVGGDRTGGGVHLSSIVAGAVGVGLPCDTHAASTLPPPLLSCVICRLNPEIFHQREWLAAVTSVVHSEAKADKATAKASLDQARGELNVRERIVSG